jgi:hypothetical protein
MPSDEWKAHVEYVMSAGSMAEAKRRLDGLDADEVIVTVCNALGLDLEAPASPAPPLAGE